MIKEFVDKWEANKKAIRSVFQRRHPDRYSDIVRAVIEAISHGEEYDWPDPERIVEIDHGDYQGMLLYVIGAKGYQPSTYWFVTVDYGSCSGCDTLQEIKDLNWEAEDTVPTSKQVDQYMTLALHIVQGIKLMTGNFES